MTDTKSHWEHVYGTKSPESASWYQPVPQRSMAMIRRTGVPPEAPVIDVGGGASTLVDILRNSGYTDITVLDISGAALECARQRLGPAAGQVRWLEADITAFEPEGRYYLWHDRAVFHFLTDAGRVGRYLDALRTALVPGGHFVLATFGPQGPNRCSGLDVQRYSVDGLANLLDAEYALQHFELEDHTTPSGNVQEFLYSWWRARN